MLRLFAATMISLVVASACGSSEHRDVSSLIPRYKVYVGMPAREFSEINESDAGGRIGQVGIHLSGYHDIYYWDKSGGHSVLIPHVGGDAGSATSISVDYNFRGGRGGDEAVISSITLYLESAPKAGVERTFEEAYGFCEAAIGRLDAAGWSGATEEFFETHGRARGWGSFEELRDRLPNEPLLSEVDVDQRTLGDVTASCSIERNNYIARDLGFTNGLTAEGNDPNAKMYVAVLSFFKK